MVILTKAECKTLVKFLKEYTTYVKGISFNRSSEDVLIVNSNFGNFKLFPDGRYFSFKDVSEHVDKSEDVVSEED